MIRGLFKKIIIGLVATGTAATATVATTAGLEAAGAINITTEEKRFYHGNWYNDDVLLYEQNYMRGEPLKYVGETPTKRDYDGGDIYVFSGWDLTGDNIPELLPDFSINKCYSNFSAHACYKKIPESLLEKIDWEQLLNILMDQNIDLEALLSKLGLSPEDIARLLDIKTLSVKSNRTGPAYLRTESFGDYNKKKNGWGDASYYDTSRISPGSVNPLQYTAYKCSQLASNPLFASYALQGDYEISYNKKGKKYPTIAFELSNNQGIPSDSYSVDSVGDDNFYSTKGFALVPCTEQTVLVGLTTSFGNQAIDDDEKEYRNYVREHYLNVDEEYKQYFLALNENYVHADLHNVGQAVTALTNYFTQGFMINLSHNGFPKNKDPLLYFMDTAKNAESNYFATATTLFLRSLGYPARYTQGYLAAISNPDEWTDVSPLQSYAWCEVYVDGIGWMNADTAMYLVAGAFLDLGITPPGSDVMKMDQKGISKRLVRLETGENTRFEFIGGTEFDYDKDLELVAVYSDGVTESKEVVKPSRTVDVDISKTKGPYTAHPIAFYEYLNTTKYLSYEIKVLPLMLEEFTVKSGINYYPTSIVQDEDFTMTGKFNDGKTRDERYFDYSRLTHDPFPENPEPGTYPVNFYYDFEWGENGESSIIASTYDLIINDPLAIIDLKPTNELTTLFYVDKEIDLFEQPFTATFNNGDVVTNYYLSPEDIYDWSGLDLKMPGSFTAIIKAGSKCTPYEYHFEVIENVTTGIEISNYKQVYYIKDTTTQIDWKTELEIIAHYLDGEERLVEIDEEGINLTYDPFVGEGTYNIDVSYTKNFKFSGAITQKASYEVEVKFLENIEFIALEWSVIIIDVGNDILDYQIDNLLFNAYYNDESFEQILGNDDRLEFDFSSVDVNTIGRQYGSVTFSYSEFLDPVTIDVEVRVRGLDHIEAGFDSMPENLYTEHIYNVYDWGMFATAFVSYDGINIEEEKIVYGANPLLTVDITNPAMFENPGDITITMTYTLGNVTKTDSKLFNVIKRELVDVDFNFDSVDSKVLYDWETINLNSVYAIGTFNDESKETFYYSNGQIIADDAIVDIDTTTNVVTHEVTLSLTMDDVTFDDSFIYYVEKPKDLRINTDNVRKSFDVRVSEFDFSDSSLFLQYNSLTEIHIPSDNATFEFEDEHKLGLNTVKVTYVYSDDITLTTEFEVEFYETLFGVTPEDIIYYEGDYFNVYGPTGEVSFKVGEGMSAKDPVDVTWSMQYPESKILEAGDNEFTYSYSNDEVTLEDTITIDAYRFIDFYITGENIKTTYFRKDQVKWEDYQKMVFNLKFKSDKTGAEKVITKSISDVTPVKGFNTEILGKNEIEFKTTVGKTTLSTKLEYVVLEPKMTGFTIDVTQAKQLEVHTKINGGLSGSLSYQGTKYTVTFENGYSETHSIDDVVNYWTLERDDIFDGVEENNIKSGIYRDTVTISHDYGELTEGGELTESQTLGPQFITYTVVKNNISELYLDTSAVKTTFFKNLLGKRDEEFSDEGLVIYAKCDYIDGENQYEFNDSQYIKLENLDEQVTINKPVFDQPGKYAETVTVTEDYSSTTISASYDVDYVLDKKTNIILQYKVKGVGQAKEEICDSGVTVLEGTEFDINNLSAYALYISADYYGNSDASTVDMTALDDYITPDLSKPTTDEGTTMNATFIIDGERIVSKDFVFYVVAKSSKFRSVSIKTNSEKEDNSLELAIGDTETFNKYIDSIVVQGISDFAPVTLKKDVDYTVDTSEVKLNEVGEYFVIVRVRHEDISQDTVLIVSVIDDLRVKDVAWIGGNVFELHSKPYTNNDISKLRVQFNFNSPSVGSVALSKGEEIVITYNDVSHKLKCTRVSVIGGEDAFVTNKTGSNYYFTLSVTYKFDGVSKTSTVEVNYSVI